MAWPQCNTTLENERRTLRTESDFGNVEADHGSRQRGTCLAWHDLPSFRSHPLSSIWTDSRHHIMVSDMEARNPLSEALGAETVSLPHACQRYYTIQAKQSTASSGYSSWSPSTPRFLSCLMPSIGMRYTSKWSGIVTKPSPWPVFLRSCVIILHRICTVRKITSEASDRSLGCGHSIG